MELKRNRNPRRSRDLEFMKEGREKKRVGKCIVSFRVRRRPSVWVPRRRKVEGSRREQIGRAHV